MIPEWTRLEILCTHGIHGQLINRTKQMISCSYGRQLMTPINSILLHMVIKSGCCIMICALLFRSLRLEPYYLSSRSLVYKCFVYNLAWQELSDKKWSEFCLVFPRALEAVIASWVCYVLCWNRVVYIGSVFFILAFDFCRFCVIIRFLHPRHNNLQLRSIPDLIHYIIFLILILEKEPVFPF